YATVKGLTPEQKIVTRFWEDNPGATGTPPGHWIAITGQIVRAERMPLTAAAETFARVGIAVADAFMLAYEVHLQSAAASDVHPQGDGSSLVAPSHHTTVSGVHLRSLGAVGGGGNGTDEQVGRQAVYRHDPRRSWLGAPSEASLVQLIR